MMTYWVKKKKIKFVQVVAEKRKLNWRKKIISLQCNICSREIQFEWEIYRCFIVG